MSNNKRLSRVIALLMVIFLLSSLFMGCKKAEDKEQNNNLSFDEFTEQLFVESLKGDAFSINYYLKYPEKYNLEKEKTDLGSYDKKQYDEMIETTKEYIEQLKKYDYDKLTREQKITYDSILTELTLRSEGSDFYFYQTSVGSYLGFNAQLPILIPEYRIDDKVDVENLLDLMSGVKPYFESCVKFEQDKIENGYGTFDFIFEGTIEQCDNLVNGERENNSLLLVTSDAIEACELLTEEEKVHYKAEIKKVINDNFLPAYEYLGAELRKLLGKGNAKELCKLPRGKEYYEILFAQATSSEMSVDEARKLFENARDERFAEIVRILTEAGNSYNPYETIEYAPDMNAEEMLNYLYGRMKEDFPQIPETECDIKEVHKSMQENTSPAYYMLSPIDIKDAREFITVNPSEMQDNNYLFTVLAHEAYPGHLYQNVYDKNKDISEVRYVLNCTGAKEAWATYVEYYVLKYAEGDELLKEISIIEKELTYILFALADIGVNYDNWTIEDIEKEFSMLLQADAEYIYEAVTENPTNVLEYYLGYLEILDLRKEAQKILGDKYTDMEFHRYILDVGPAPFSVLKKYFNEYIDANK